MRAVGPFRRVLAGYDGSPDAAEAVRAAVAIAARDGGHVVTLSVVGRHPHTDGNDGHDEAERNLRGRAEALFEQLRRDLPPGGAVRMTAQVVYSDGRGPGAVVTEYAAVHGFDVLVLGRHGDGRRRTARLGQVADAAVHACSVPVMLLSPP
jgi:nucleotide-binding universal stress UspA family protein